MPGEAIDWVTGSGLMCIDQPDVVDAAFDRGEPLVGVAVIGLALTHSDPSVILARVARAMEHPDLEIRGQGTLALAHTGRLHGTVDEKTLLLLRGRPRGNPADDDLWMFVPRRKLPWWLWQHQLPDIFRWFLWQRWPL